MANENEARLKYIVHKSKALERSLGSLETYLNGESPDLENAECRLKVIKGIFDGYVTNHEELITLQHDHSRVNAYNQIESQYAALTSRVHKLRPAVPAPLADSTVLNGTNLTLTERRDTPKLPTINIPKFDGKHESWAKWKNSFESLVHNRPETSALVKQSYLNTAVEGSVAEVVIAEFPEKESNYPLAWAALCKAYDQTRIIITEHLDALFTLPQLKEANPELLAGLMYKTRHRIILLEALGVKVADAVAIRLLERAVPPSVYSRWVDTLKGNKIPKVDELYDFIQETINKIRQMKTMPQNLSKQQKRPAENTPSKQSKSFKSSTHSFVTTSNPSDSTCLKCGQTHRLYKCTAFKELNLGEKYRIVNNNKLCRNCLCAHKSPCTSKSRCKEAGCNKPHHTLLHPHKKSKEPDSAEKGQS